MQSRKGIRNMKFLKFFLPNLTIALSVGLVVLLYLDNRNPMMGLLYGKPFMVYGAVLAVCGICVSVMAYISWRKEKSARGRNSGGRFDIGAKKNSREDAPSHDVQG